MGGAFSVNTLDLFSEPVHFSFKKKTYFKTTCGGAVSIILAIMLVLYLYYLIDELLTRKVPIISDSRNIFENPQNFTISKDPNFTDINIPFVYEPDKFIFYNAFGIYNNRKNFYLSFTDEYQKYIDLEIDQISIDDNGKLNRRSLNFELCRKFANYTERFESLGLERMYCINDAFEIAGYVNQPNSKSIEIKLKKCNNSTANLKGIICNSDSIINSFTKEFQFEWYFDNWIINTTKIQIAEVIANNLEQKYWDILSEYTKKCTIALGKDAIRLYNSYIPDFLFSGYTELDTLAIRDFITEISDMDYEGNLLQITLAASDLKIIYERRYLDIFSQMATLGGMCDVLFLIGFIFVWYISREKFNEELVNTFYDISDPNSKGESYLQSKFRALNENGYATYLLDENKKDMKNNNNEFHDYIRNLYNFHRHQAIRKFYAEYANHEKKNAFNGVNEFGKYFFKNRNWKCE